MSNVSSKLYATVDDFYEDRGGRHSDEADYGVSNYDDLGLFRVGNVVSYPVVRVSVVEETGDVYARSLSGEFGVALLGNLGIGNPTATKYRSLSESGPVYTVADECFAEWESNPDGGGRPLSWFLERIGDGSHR